MIKKSKMRFALHFSSWPLESHSFGLKYGHFRYHQLQKCPNSKNYFVKAHWKRNVLMTTLRFGHQHPLSFYTSVGHQHSKHVTNSEIQTPQSTNSHQLSVTNLKMSPTSLSVTVCYQNFKLVIDIIRLHPSSTSI